MKITIIHGAEGQLAAIVHGHVSEHERQAPAAGMPRATLRPQPGQSFHEVEAPETLRGQSHEVLRRWVAENHRGRATGRE